MKKDEFKILKSLKNIRLDIVEKEEIKKRLIANIDAPHHSFIWSHSMKTAIALVLVTISLGSTIVFAAEQALPGDFLYPVKTNINEKVERALVTSSPVSQAKFETKLVEKRLKEAEELTKGKDLEESKKDIVKKEIERQTEKAEEAILKAKEIKKEKKESNEKREEKKQEDKNEDNKIENNKNRSNNKKDDDSDDKDSDLDRIYKKHENVVKKLDIKKENRSRKD